VPAGGTGSAQCVAAAGAACRFVASTALMKRRRRKRLHQDPAAALLSHSPYVHSITPRHTSRRWATPTRARSNHVGRSTTITASQIRSFILSRGGEPRQLHFGAVERAPSKTKRPSSASRARKVLQEEHSGNAAARQFALIAAQGDGSTRSTASRSDVLLATVLGHGTLPVEPMSHHTMISEEQRKSPSLQQAASKRPAHAAQQDAACPAPQTSAAARRHSVKSHPDHWIQQQQGPQQQQENPVRGVHIAGPPVFPVTRARCKERGASPNEKGRSSKTRKIRKRSTLRGTEGTVRRRLRAAIEQANSAVHGAPGAWTKHDKDRTQVHSSEHSCWMFLDLMASWAFACTGTVGRAPSRCFRSCGRPSAREEATPAVARSLAAAHGDSTWQWCTVCHRCCGGSWLSCVQGQAVPSTLTIQPGAVPMDRVYKVLENAIRPPPVRPLYALLGSPKAHHGVGAPHTSHSAQRVSRYTLRQCPGWHSAIPGRLSHVLRGVLEALLDRALLDLCSHKNCPHR